MTYQQRYYVNEEYWKKPDGPVFIFIGGEGELSPYNMMEGKTLLELMYTLIVAGKVFETRTNAVRGIAYHTQFAHL